MAHMERMGQIVHKDQIHQIEQMTHMRRIGQIYQIEQMGQMERMRQIEHKKAIVSN